MCLASGARCRSRGATEMPLSSSLRSALVGVQFLGKKRVGGGLRGQFGRNGHGGLLSSLHGAGFPVRPSSEGQRTARKGFGGVRTLLSLVFSLPFPFPIRRRRPQQPSWHWLSCWAVLRMSAYSENRGGGYAPSFLRFHPAVSLFSDSSSPSSAAFLALLFLFGRPPKCQRTARKGFRGGGIRTVPFSLAVCWGFRPRSRGRVCEPSTVLVQRSWFGVWGPSCGCGVVREASGVVGGKQALWWWETRG